MAVYSDLSNGELLGELRELAEEARKRVADYVDRAKDSDEALHAGIVFAKKVELALHPGRGSFRSLFMLKYDLEDIAASRPDDPAAGEWEEFLDDHPELAHAEPDVRVPLDFDDDAIVAALEDALAERARTRRALSEGRYDTVWSSCVANVLLGDRMPKMERPGPSRGAWHGVVVRVGRRLSALAKQGRVVKLRPRDGGPCQWTFPGRDLSEATLRGLVVEGGDAA